MSANETLAVDAETVDAIHEATLRCGSQAWGATTYSGERLLGNGLGDTGRGETWQAALDDLRAKHAARMDRQNRLEAGSPAKDRVTFWLWLALLALLVLGALWWTWTSGGSL